MSIGSSLFRRDDSPIDAYVWIGLDFGTATTECVVRIETRGEQDAVMVVASGGDSRTDAVVVTPSAVEIQESILRTGIDLEGAGQVIDNLKLDLIGEAVESHSSENLYRVHGPYFRSLIHLAAVLAMVRKAVDKRLGKKRVGYYLNIAAPIGPDTASAHHQRVRTVFHDLAFRALSLSAMVFEWPIPLSQLDELCRSIKTIHVPTLDDSPVNVVPEALAAVTAFLHAPNRVAGNYATIDVGGGTTDVSFFWFQTGTFAATGEKKAWYYSIRSVPFGMSCLFDGLTETIAEQSGRTRHERLRSIRSLSAYEQRIQLRDFLAGLKSAYDAAFKESFAVRPNFRDWCENGLSGWNLLLLGGGVSDTLIHDHLSGHVPHSRVGPHRRVENLGVPRNLDLILPSGRILSANDGSLGRFDIDVLQVNDHMLTVAYGLSFRAPDIPRYGMEEPIAPPTPPRPWEPPAHKVHA